MSPEERALQRGWENDEEKGEKFGLIILLFP